MEFSARLKKLRKLNKYTQEDLAKLLGITAGAIGLYEQNRREPDNDTVKHLAKIFNVSIDYLLGFDEFTMETPPRTGYEHSLGTTSLKGHFNSPHTFILYSDDPLKQEIAELTHNILDNISDESKLKQIKMFLDTYKK